MEPSLVNRLRVRGLYVGLAFLILFVQTLPITFSFSHFLAPDVLLAITFAWVLRRPDAITPLVIGVVFLANDFILHRPPGLWTAIVLIACVFLQGRIPRLKDAVYSIEFGLVIGMMIVCFLGYQILLVVTFSGAQPPLPSILQLITTIVIYPLVTFGSRRMFGLSRLSTTDRNIGRVSS